MTVLLAFFAAHPELVPVALAGVDALVGLVAARFPALHDVCSKLLPDVDGLVKSLLAPKKDENQS